MRRAVGIAFAAILVLAASAGAQADTLKVAVPQKGNWDTSIPDFALKIGAFKEVGLDVEITYTQGGASNEQAVISGSVDVGIGTGLLGIVSAYVKGAPVRVISAEITGAPDMYFFARADRGIKSLKDAHGKTIAYSNPGSSSNLVTLALLKQAGIADAEPIAAGGIQGIYTQVLSGQIDIGHAVPPMGLQDLKDHKIVIVAWGNDVPEIRDQTVRVNVANLNFLQTRRDAVIRFMKAYQKTLDWAYSGDPRAIDWYAEGMHVTRDLAQQSFAYYPKAVMQPWEIKALDRTLADALAAKRIPKAMTPEDVKGLIDIVWQPGK